jgi:hypothetical protein
MLLFHYQVFLCNNLLSWRFLWVFTCRFYNMVNLFSLLVSSDSGTYSYKCSISTLPVFSCTRSRLSEHTLYITSLCILFFCQFFLQTLIIYLPIYAASHSFARNTSAVLIYQATRCKFPQMSNLQNQSSGNREFHTVPVGLLASVICV